ncbi:acetate--CoA ligase family protein [Williamsia soli]|uniref:acetate--CoA ligase family protein n=1 Tax=Williamsia soli TaxID=364929 RepID=UPI001A9FCB37|nr:acetate--CoA ligase family protein [Williamsia soli]
MTVTVRTLTEGDVVDSAGNLDALFAPTSIAVVGASSSAGKLGSVMLAAINRGKSGSVTSVGINPKGEGDGFETSLAAATSTHGRAIDLAVMCIPAVATPDAIREAADCGVRAALICSGGFAEAGPEGSRLQEELRTIVDSTGIRLLGPNTSGFFRPAILSVSFVPTVEYIRPGPVAVVAASGGMNHALSFLLSESGVGVGLGVGLGNSVDVTSVDVLRYLHRDETVRAIALHVESIDDGEALLAAVRDVSADKPIVAIVVGKADVSAFSESHTGALATSWRTTRALLAEAGAVVVGSEHELVDALAVLSRTRLPALQDPGIGLVTAQAGPGLMILDDLLAGGVRVPPLAEQTTSALAELLPPMTFQSNPVDTGRPGATFGRVLDVASADGGIDALAVYALAEPDVIDLAAVVGESSALATVPVVLGIGGPSQVTAASTVRAAELGVPVRSSPTSLAAGVRALVQDSRVRFLHGVDAETAAPVLRIALPADEATAKDALDELGFATPKRHVCSSRDGAHAALAALQAPVAVKILDAAVLHKTDIGGVHLGVRTADDLDRALDALDGIGAAAYLLEEMADSGVDLFLGVRRDTVFGPIVVAGVGGTAAEAIGDVTIKSGRVTPTGAAAMLEELQFAPVLDGWRGGPTLDRKQFARHAVTLAQCLQSHPEIQEIEINPFRLTSAGLIALDAVIVPAAENSAGDQT